MVRNLLENAVRHTPERTTVELTARRDGDEALLEVSTTARASPSGSRSRSSTASCVATVPPTPSVEAAAASALRSSARSRSRTAALSSPGKSTYGGARFSIRLPLEKVGEEPRPPKCGPIEKSFSKRSRTPPRFRTGRDTSPAVRNPTHHGETR